MDTYASFKDLTDHEVEGIDYRIRSRAGSTGIALLSIHGGDIEPGTSEIAEGIAGGDHTFYALEGMKTCGNKTLHITSTAFDEPLGIEIANNSEMVLSIHGCSEPGEAVYPGGLDQTLRAHIEEKLAKNGFETIVERNLGFGGTDPRNICNLCGRGMGVQIEVSLGLRRRMFQDLTAGGRRLPSEVYYRFVSAVRYGLAPVGQGRKGTKGR